MSEGFPSESTPFAILRSSITAIPFCFTIILFSSEILPATPPTERFLK
jgi:hypothetical protein